MIGKKINQLATELAPVSTDLTIIGDPDSGVSKKITLAQLGAIFSGAVSFYTNLAGFPAVGDINVIYCAKDTQKLYLWSGSAYVEVFPSQALLDTYQLRSEKGNANGYASLDSQGKVPITQLPSSIMEYKGTWNASTNTPTLANGTGDTGDVYICNVAGTVNFGAGPITFAVGDYVIYSGTIWQRSSGAVGTVTSVAASITGDSVTISGSPVTTSGTLAFAFAGTGAQYIKGDGTLATFPNTIDQAKNLITEVYNSTGATLTKGTVVYINGGQGNLPTITKALASGDSTSAQTYGIVQNDITNNNNGFVVVAGRLSDIDTQAFSVGTQLYLSSTTAGAYTSTKQYAPAHLVYVGIIVRSHPTQGIIEVKIQNGYELDELHNVAAQTPTNNDGLFWEASTSLWKNKSIATILGYTPQAQLNGTGFVKASGTTITYDNSTYLTTSAAATTYLPLVLSSTANVVDINGQQFNIWGSAGGFTSGRIIVDPVFSAIGYQNAGVFDGLKILTNGNAEFSNSGITRFFNQVRFDSTLTNGTYTYTLPGATGTLALVSQLTGGTVTSVGLSVPTGFAVSGSPVTSSGTLALAFDTGYSLPTIVKQNNWDTAYNTRIVTASSPLSFISNTISISQASGSANGFLSSTDWTTFNNKQNALTNPVTGTGTTNYLPKFTGASTIGDSQVFDNGTNVGIGTATPSYKLDVSGAIQTSVASGNGSLYINNSSLSGKFWTLIPETSSGETNLLWYYGGAGASVKMNLTNTGNLGLGVVPSAWATIAPAFQVNSASFSSFDNSANVAANFFHNGTSDRYINNGFATLYQQYTGRHIWYNAPSGTAGNAISFTQAMTLDASGRLGINTTSPGSYSSPANQLVVGTNSGNNGITIAGGTTGLSSIYFADGTTGNEAFRGYIEYGHSSDALSFGTAASTRLTITNGGNVGIGTTAPTNTGGYATLTVGGATSTLGQITWNSGTTAIGYAYNDGNNMYIGSNSALIFATTSAATERMRITSGGTLLVGTTTTTGLTTGSSVNVGISLGGGVISSQVNNNSNQYWSKASGYTSGDFTAHFVNNTYVGGISTNGSSTTYATASDYRLKSDFKDFNGLDLVAKIKTYDYEYKSDKSRSYGVIAHELQSIINYAVTGVKDGEQMQGVDYSKIVPVLIKAIQEQQLQIEQLKNK